MPIDAQKPVANLAPPDFLARLVAPDYKPPLLPAIAIELNNLLRKPSVSIREIASLLERDPMLSATTLRLANSAAQQGNSPIRSISEALTRIGLRRASEFFYRAALESEVFHCKGGEQLMNRLRKHSVATAEIARQVDQATLAHSESAYLCGLLHDIGITACILALGLEQRHAAAANFDLFWPSISKAQTQFGLRVAREWALPSEIQSVIYHHTSFGSTPSPHPLSAVTYFSEHLACVAGHAFTNANPGEHVEKAVQVLGLSTKQRAFFEENAKAITAAVA